jgi:hypothetical protein
LSDRKLKVSHFPRKISLAGEQGEWVKGAVIGEIFAWYDSRRAKHWATIVFV